MKSAKPILDKRFRLQEGPMGGDNSCIPITSSSRPACFNTDAFRVSIHVSVALQMVYLPNPFSWSLNKRVRGPIQVYPQNSEQSVQYLVALSGHIIAVINNSIIFNSSQAFSLVQSHTNSYEHPQLQWITDRSLTDRFFGMTESNSQIIPPLQRLQQK